MTIHNTNQRQTSHTYGIMCKKCSLSNTTYNATFNYHSSTLVPPPSFTFLYVPISALLPDLHHVDLKSGNFMDATTRTRATSMNQIENIPTDTVFPLVPTFLVEKIESGAFIEMGDFIPTYLG